jgi:hypothetical protein
VPVLLLGGLIAIGAPPESNPVRPSTFRRRLVERLQIEPAPVDIPEVRLRIHGKTMVAHLRHPNHPTDEDQRSVSAFINGGPTGNGRFAGQLISTRTLQMLAEVAVNFGKDEIVVIDAYRERAGYHTRGTAVDFRVPGVSNSELFNYCREFTRSGYNAGCGFYLMVNYIHMDSREEDATWCDASRGGEPSRPCTTEERAEAERRGARFRRERRNDDGVVPQDERRIFLGRAARPFVQRSLQFTHPFSRSLLSAIDASDAARRPEWP